MVSSHSIKGFEYMMDLILKDTYLVQSKKIPRPATCSLYWSLPY
ncbi:hypothetical protein [Salmonella phage SD-1_S14]|nr:hypothetical protein [Salmonella phage SD-1_S14]